MKPPQYFIITQAGHEGPYSDVDLMDLLDAGLISRKSRCQEAGGGGVFPVGDLFEVIEPPVAANAADTEVDEQDDHDDDNEDEEDEEPTAPPMALASGERCMYRGNPSLLLYWPLVMLSLASLYLGWRYATISGKSLLIGLAGAVLCMLLLTLLRSRRTYLITTRRVEAIVGLIAKSSREIRIEDIRTINVSHRGFLGLLGVGTVEFSSSGTEDGEVSFADIAGGHRVKGLLRKLQELADAD